MKCKFIDKYIDKIYSGSLNFLERQVLDSHMKKCSTCREFYDDCMEENLKIKEMLECTDVPSGIGINVMKNIDHNKYRKLKTIHMRRYAVAAAVILIIIIPLLYKYNLSNSKTPVSSKPGTVSDIIILDEDEFETRLQNYIKQNCGIKAEKGQLFASVDVIGGERNENTGNSYVLASVMEYSMNDGDYIIGKSMYTPMVIGLQRKDSLYYPVSMKVPGSGDYFKGDVEILFPEKYWGRIFSQDDDMQTLKDKNLMQAREFYKITITDFDLNLSPELLKTYNSFAKTKDYSLLKGLQPIEIYKMYFHAGEVEDYRTQYSLYYNDGKWLVPTLKDFLNDIKNDSTNKENTAKLIKMLNEDVESAYFEFIDKHEGYIVLNLKKGVSDEDPKRGFSLLRGGDGIWKVRWLPMQ